MNSEKPFFHFISGLPRSGSTLLAALLRQNPAFHAHMTSGLGSLVSGAMQMMSPGAETALTLEPGQREAILRGLFYSYYQDSCSKPMIFDTNRVWTARMPLIQTLFPEAKIISCVRDVSWIMDSLERQVRNNPCHFTRLFGAQGQGSVYGRVEALMNNNGLVGSAWCALKEAFYGEQAASMLVIDYELLSREPEQVLRLIYKYIDQPWYNAHDFNNVEFDAPDFDDALGVEGLHRVRPKVEFVPRRTILPPDLFQKFQEMDFWTSIEGSQVNVIHKSNKAETS